MIFPGHVSAGYLVAKVVLSMHPEISVAEYNKLVLLGAFSGWLPDIDIFYYFFKARSVRFEEGTTHRSYITHTPFFWIAVAFLVLLFTRSEVSALIMGLGSLSHIFFDSFGSGNGVMWFWPFSKKKVLFFNYVDKNPETDNVFKYYFLLFKDYLNTTTFYLEITITVVALLAIYFS